MKRKLIGICHSINKKLRDSFTDLLGVLFLSVIHKGMHTGRA